MILRFFLVVSILFSVSCLQGQDSQVIQAQEGTNVPIKDIVNLKCLLKTGARKDKKVPFTKALSFNLERKKKKGSYVPAKETTLTYKYQDPKDEKIKTGWLNNFGYVVPGELKEAGSFFVGREVSCENFSGLLKHPFLRAKSHHSYTVRFQVAGGFIRVLLLAPPENIPLSALAYSLKLNKNLYAMPIGGYLAPSVKMEAVKNSNWEETNAIIGKPLPFTQQSGFEERVSRNGIRHSYLKGTAYVQFKPSEFTPYKSLLEESQKVDVYPKVFFQGEWFYAVTPITSSSKGFLGGGVGQHWISLDNEGKKAHAVRFVFHEDYLMAYNVNKELGPSKSADLNRWVFQIPLKHLDYISSQSGPYRNVGLKEVLNKEYSRYQLKPWVGLDFNNVKMAIQKRAKVLNSDAGYQLEELTFSSDYFSFLIKDENTNRTMRFSLLKKPEGDSSYSPVYLTEDMLNLFPIYMANKRIILADRILRNREFLQRFPIERFNMNMTELPVRYHFSHLTPDKDSVRRIGKESINIWNQIFEKAGVSCPQEGCFVLDETQDVPLGDIRYNVFNFIDPEEPLNVAPWLAGYGPSMSDYETGEIISTTTNIYTKGVRDRLIGSIYNYIQRETGLAVPFPERGIQKRQSSTAGHTLSLWTGFFREEISMPNYIFSFLQGLKPGFSLDDGYTRIYGFHQDDEQKPPEFITSLEKAVSSEEKKRILLHYRIATGKEPPRELEDVYRELEELDEIGEGFRHSCRLQEERFGEGEELMGERIYSLIGALCGGNLSAIPNLQEKNAKTLSPHLQIEFLDKEIQQLGSEDRVSAVEREIYECADKILPLMAIGTTLHEQGHNISMRHNFAGSSDKSNFLKNEDFSHDFIFSHLEDEEETQALDIMKPDSSTVMDYLVDRVISPGAYDVAFVRFYYGEKKETTGGEIVEVDFTESIDRHSLRPYRACEDFVGRRVFWKDDIFCNSFDKGTTVSELVEHYYNRYITQPLTFSYNKILPRGRLGIIPFYFYTLNIYHKWRRVLADSLKMNISESPLLLSGMEIGKYREKIYDEIMTESCKDKGVFEGIDGIEECVCMPDSLNSEESNKELRELYCAKTKIANTFREALFFLPDHYCIVENPVGRSELIAFSDLHAKLTKSDRFSKDVSSCADVKKASEEEFQEEFEKSGWKLKERDIGYPLFSGRFSTHKNQVGRDYSIDYRGTVRERFLSGIVLFLSTSLKKPGQNFFESTVPVSLMDEPDIRGRVKAHILERITEGIKKEKLIPEHVKKYTEEEGGVGVRYPMFYARDLKMEEGDFFYAFRNEKLLWSHLSMPLLSTFGPRRNIGIVLQDILAGLGIIRPMESVHPDWRQKSAADKFLILLRLQEDYGGHVYTGDKHKEPLLIFPRGVHVKFVAGSLHEIDLISAFEDFDKSFLKWQRNDLTKFLPTPSESLDEFINSRKNFIQEQILKPVAELLGTSSQEISSETYFILTYSLLFDYLIKGLKESEELKEFKNLKDMMKKASKGVVQTGRYFITDYLVEVLQSALVIEYKSKRAFKKESPEISDVEFGKIFQLPFNPDLKPLSEKLLLSSDMGPAFEKQILKEMEPFFHLPFERYWTGTLHTDPKGEKKFNLFHPYFEYLVDCTTEDKDILNEEDFRHLIVTLFKLEAFKPGYVHISQISAGLKELLNEILQVQTDEQERNTMESIISTAEDEVEWVREKLKQLSVLKSFESNQFLRDMLFRPFFSDINKVRDIIKNLISFLDLFDTKAVQPFSGLQNFSRSFSENYLPLEVQLSRKSIAYKIIPFYANLFNLFIMRIRADGGWDILNGSEDKLVKNSTQFFDKTNVNFYTVASRVFNQEERQSTEGELVDVFTNKTEKEIRAQEDILIHSIRPYVVIIGNTDGSAGGGSASAAAHQAVSEFSQEAKERYELKRSVHFK